MNNWNRHKRKEACMHGKAYTTAKGKTVQAKQPVADEGLCNAKCRLKCSEKLYSDERVCPLAEFYRLNAEDQSTHLCAPIVPYSIREKIVNARKHRKTFFLQ